MPRRIDYVCPLASVASLEPLDDLLGSVRHPSAADHAALADLMFDAYLNTIDYDGETRAEAHNEIHSYFESVVLPPLLNCSWLYADRETLASACLVSYWPQCQCPLIAYVMTGAAWKQQALGRRLVQLSLTSLRKTAYTQVLAVITEGNIPSERLFARLGFLRLLDTP